MRRDVHLSPGTRLGPYEIVAFLGAGGMGEVYRARDKRLARDVAVKVLLPSVSADPERLRRFEQEARAAGSLDHPNVLAIHDIGSHDGVAYVVSELLEGATLRQRCEGGPLPARKTTEYAVQIARGLAAAHEKGIVHRDLKPENLFLTRAGLVKILDFGLAKLAPFPIVEGAIGDPTRTRDTGPGTVLGTVGYMSPEQARGQAVDHRSDIFSLGAILYEMLTGRRAFRGATAADTLTAILREEAAFDPAAQPGIPPALERVIRHCLEKDVGERFQSARDLVFDLEAISAPSGTSAAGVPAGGRSRAARMAAAPVALLVALAAAFGAYELGRGSRPGLQQVHRLTFRRGTVTSARFAPDGQTIVYGAQWEGQPVELFSTRAGSPESRHLGLPSADVLAVSPAGEMALSLGRRELVGWEARGTLARASLSGGAPREVLENVHDADWTPDGEQLAVVRIVEGRSRLEFPMGKVLYQTGGWISHPRFSPKKDWIAFFEHPIRGDNAGWVAAVDRAGNKKDLSDMCTATLGLCWDPSGTEILYSGFCPTAPSRLQAVTVSGRRRSIAEFAGGASVQDVARDGRMLMLFQDLRREIVGLAPGADRERNLSWLDWSFPRDLAADGKTLLIEEQGGGAPRNGIYLRKTDGSQAVRLADGRSLALSPDDKWALSVLEAGPGPQLVLLPIGPGEPRVLLGPRFTYQWASWHPGGKQIVFAAIEGGRAARIYTMDVAGGAPRPATPDGIGIVSRGLSPDGDRVAAIAPDRTISVYPLGGGSPRPIPGLTDADTVVGWTSDGRSLYVQPGSERARVYKVDVATGRREFWKEFRVPDPAGVSTVGPILVGSDGKSYVYSYRRVLSDLYLIEGLR